MVVTLPNGAVSHRQIEGMGFTDIGLRRGSVRMRCAHASVSIFAVVILGWEEGVDVSSAGFLETTRDDSGDRSVALVPFGSARRATARDLGFGVVIAADADAETCEAAGVLTAAGSAMRPIALGVGVAGGGVVVLVAFRPRRFGVDGAAVNGSTSFTAGAAGSEAGAGAGDEAFLFRDLVAGAGGGGMGDASAWALKRADLLLAMVRYVVRSGRRRRRLCRTISL